MTMTSFWPVTTTIPLTAEQAMTRYWENPVTSRYLEEPAATPYLVSLATTPSRAVQATTSSTADWGETCSTAVSITISSPAATAKTRFWVQKATTRHSEVRSTTTCWAKPAPTPC